MMEIYKQLLNDLDDFMIALNKQKKLGCDPDIMNTLKQLAKTRNKFKKLYNEELTKLPKRSQTIATQFLDKVADETAQ